jgi:hypothetical protein
MRETVDWLLLFLVSAFALVGLVALFQDTLR